MRDYQMDIKLPKRLDEFVQERVKSGLYNDGTDVISEALRFWMACKDSAKNPSYPAGFPLGGGGSIPPGADIEELAYIVLMNATNDQDEDLQEIMAQVKAMNSAKRTIWQLLSRIRKP
jgi:hypothetical protein